MKLKNTRIQNLILLLNQVDQNQQFHDALSLYHASDIADAMQQISEDTRKQVYQKIDLDLLSDIFTYFDHVSKYITELEPDVALALIKNMDDDDALSILDDIEDTSFKNQLLARMDERSFKDIRFISSFPEDEVGHMMTTNYVTILNTYTIKEAMRSVIDQAHEKDNVNTIFVLDQMNNYLGVVNLKDLIIAREHTKLEDIVIQNHPKVYVTDKVSEVIEQLKDYGEDFIPVLNKEKRLVGIITLDDIIDAFDEEMSEDYAKLAGLTAEEDINETILESIKKRMPWLILLLGLGLIVSSVVGIFERIVEQVSIVILFQSLILDMAGNVGTQSLAVTIRVLMDEEVSGKTKLKFMLKETKIGGTNGLLLGMLAFCVVSIFLVSMKHYTFSQSFLIAGCVSLALFLAMLTSAFVGTAIPIFFHKIKVDPAVASGPLITTINDLIAVITYYSLAGLLLLQLHL